MTGALRVNRFLVYQFPHTSTIVITIIIIIIIIIIFVIIIIIIIVIKIKKKKTKQKNKKTKKKKKKKTRHIQNRLGIKIKFFCFFFCIKNLKDVEIRFVHVYFQCLVWASPPANFVGNSWCCALSTDDCSLLELLFHHVNCLIISGPALVPSFLQYKVVWRGIVGNVVRRGRGGESGMEPEL